MEFCNDGALEVSMIKYLKNVITEFLELIKGRAATPAHDKLFVIRLGLYSDPRIEQQRCARKFLVISFSILASFFLLRPLPPIRTKSPSRLDRPIDE